jgi:hypothetical protein
MDLKNWNYKWYQICPPHVPYIQPFLVVEVFVRLNYALQSYHMFKTYKDMILKLSIKLLAKSIKNPSIKPKVFI